MTLSIKETLLAIGQNAKTASRVIGRAETRIKNEALQRMAHALREGESTLLSENAKDLSAGRNKGLEGALLDRLELTPARIAQMADGLLEIAALRDPIGEISDLVYRPSGIQVGRMRVPLGVIGIIFESRPNVTADAAALCLKSGNAAILRGGSESIHSNRAIASALNQGIAAAGLPVSTIQLVETTDRAAVGELLALDRFVDVIIPRGGKPLIERVLAESRIPVIKHLDGLCHVYIDDGADPQMALRIAVDAKTHRFGVCNAMETLLVARSMADAILPALAEILAAHQVEIRACSETRTHLPRATPATESDWNTEYLAPILAIRIVADLEEAMAHIAAHGSGHTEAIVTEDYGRARRFLREVDASSVMVNASTRFADGYEYGLGAEIGISTDKLHARGPVGLEGLTTQKFVVLGNGHVRGG